MNSLAIVPTAEHRALEVSDESIGRLLDWVLEASPQEVTWNADRISEMRDWLKTHKAAKDLRVKAVRLELIALRKIGVAGLAGKIKAQQGSAAKWLASLGDDEFTNVLSTVSAADTPIGLHRRSISESNDVRWWIENARISDGHVIHGIAGETFHSVDLHNAVRRVLEEVTTDGESFTIAEAADRLSEALHREGRIEEYSEPYAAILRGEPLREVVRRATRVASDDTYQDEFGEELSRPDFVTYTEDGRGGYVRIPWQSAGLEQFRFMISLRRDQLDTMRRKVDRLEKALALMESVVTEGDDEPKCESLWMRLLHTKKISAVSA